MYHHLNKIWCTLTLSFIPLSKSKLFMQVWCLESFVYIIITCVYYLCEALNSCTMSAITVHLKYNICCCIVTHGSQTVFLCTWQEPVDRLSFYKGLLARHQMKPLSVYCLLYHSYTVQLWEQDYWDKLFKMSITEVSVLINGNFLCSIFCLCLLSSVKQVKCLELISAVVFLWHLKAVPVNLQHAIKRPLNASEIRQP